MSVITSWPVSLHGNTEIIFLLHGVGEPANFSFLIFSLDLILLATNLKVISLTWISVKNINMLDLRSTVVQAEETGVL